MVYDCETAARRAEASTTNTPGTCQLWTRTQFGAPSAGDRDRDGDADAVDGWKSEPSWARHADRRPPRGVAGAFSGGSRGFGHRVVTLGGGKVRSTDMGDDGRYRPGHVGTVTIEQIERAMGVTWLGWSETITGLPIPLPPAPEPARRKRKRPEHVVGAIKEARAALADADGKPRQRGKIRRALDSLLSIKKR